MKQYEDGNILFSDEEQSYICDKIENSGYSISKILDMYNLKINDKHRKAVQDIIDKFNIEYKYNWYSKGRKYFFNDGYFDQIDCSEKAYWLGFLYADGFITGKNSFGCALQANDVDHLRKFLKAICISEDPLRYYEKTNSYRFILTNKKMVDTLKTCGFTNNKSYDLTELPFLQIPDNYKKFFILGMWDGDGYVSISGENKNMTGIVSNNEILLLSMSKYINKHFGNNFVKVVKYDGYPRIRLSCNKAYKFLVWLYDQSNIYLDRKHDIFLKFSNGYYSKYNYRYIRKLPSGRYYIHLPSEFNSKSIGTFNTVKEAIEAFNNEAIKLNIQTQEYIGEEILKNE